ncbi:MAG: hypothetical protein HY980_03240 [Candidatus Magasanikbacteria bacterium]|nr:hypothetical protein [Candidatus Magasanikbacteria bacterium]
MESASHTRESPTDETPQSYLGLLRHGNALKAKDELLNVYWLWKED